MRARSRYLVGIDLGTTNSVVAYIDTETEDSCRSRIPVLAVPQLVAAGEVGGSVRLPSFLYLPAADELPLGSLALPWDPARSFAVGEFARVRGAQVPGRLVSSAKSWLCYGEVDRTAGILPWGASEEIDRLSPVEASARFLSHLREAWDSTLAAGDEGLKLEHQQVILTVPASFDEVARELTVEAARLAHIEHLTLIEEPQAAFYAWLFRHRETWRDEIHPDELILVCDVGGGTTDFSLIQVEAKGEEIGFRRIAVGEHLLLGGDNMDLALAAELEPRLVGGGKRLDAMQWSALKHRCRLAKEWLIGPEARDAVSIAVPGRGSRIVGGTLHCDLTREQALRCIVDGFFPKTAAEELPRREARVALQEFGLPYAPDPAISRHLAAFLRDPAMAGEGACRRPDLVLLNGGVFNAPHLQTRLMDLLASWFPKDRPPRLLDADDEALDLAVAQGAAYYGLVRQGRGARIAGGAAQSFYVGLDPASFGDDPASASARAICIAPQGLEEGEGVDVADRDFELLIREPVRFPFYSSRTRPGDRVGTVVPVDPSTMRSLPPVQTVLRSGHRSASERIRVRLHAILTEVGILEVWCVNTGANRRWRLQFDVRKDAGIETGPALADGAISEEEVLPAERIDQAISCIRETFQSCGMVGSGAPRPEHLMKRLEASLEKGRRSWPPGTLRDLWKAMQDVAERRTTHAGLEARWLNLAGYLLRPGYGYPLDEWRMRQIWRLFDQGVVHRKDAQVRAEWWILWRRVAGGLNKGQQVELFRRMEPVLVPEKGTPPSRLRKGDQEMVEMWRVAASLERIPPRHKKSLGEALLRQAEDRAPMPFELWSLGRLGARTPLYGPVDTVVSREIAEEWIRRLLQLGAANCAEGRFALAEIARRCGDRARDIDEEVRDRVLLTLRQASADEHLVRLVEEVTGLREDEQALAFGDSLPPALRLVN